MHDPRYSPCGCLDCSMAEMEGIPDDQPLTLMERYRLNEYAGLTDEPLPFPELAHSHQWNGDDYCDICGADGRA